MKEKKVDIPDSWYKALQDYFERPEWKELTDYVREQYQEKTVFPHPKNIFRAFDECSFDDVRVVILGQDPYHTPGVAEGLAFSIPDGLPIQPSLRNIFTELENDITLGSQASKRSSSLVSWAQQGVLLLNSVLTVEQGQAGSHAGKGWEEFTDYVIQKLSDEKEHVVFILWGAYAQKKGSIIGPKKHLVIKSPHPSPLSAHRGFFGSKPFSQTNKYLLKNDMDKINW